MATNIQDGVYNAIPTVAAVYEKNDALKLEIHFTLCDEGGNAYTHTGTDGNEYPIEKYNYYNLVNADGVVNTNVINGICAWSKWDGADPFWWTDSANVNSIGMVEVTLETQTWQGKTRQQVKWVNELGHNAKHGGSRITESGDRAAIMAKYGAKLKAAFGGRPRTVQATGTPAAPKPQGVSAPAARPAPAPAPKAPQRLAPAPSAAPAYSDGVAGMNAVWDAFAAANKGVKTSDLEERWFAAIDKHSDGCDQADMTGEQWAKVANELLGGDLAEDPDNIPY